MTNPEASCSSRSESVEGPILSGSAGRVAVHESHDLVSDASNMQPPPSLKSVTIRLGIDSTAFMNNPPYPRNAASTSAIRSSWIQRLKPSTPSCTPKEEPCNFSKKEKFVCTHFSKDYSSCSKRLNKSPHHSRSSSWPPHGAQSKALMPFPMDTEENRVAEEHENTALNFPHPDHKSICVPSKNTTESSEAGSRTGTQQDGRKLVPTLEGFVPCAQHSALNRYTSSMGRSNCLQDSEDGDHRKPKTYYGQEFQDLRKDTKKVDFAALSKQVKPQGQSQDARHSSGASADADADASICYAKPVNFSMLDRKEIHQTCFEESGVKVNYPAAVVSRNRGKIDKFGLILPSEKEAVLDGLAMGFKDAGDLELSQVRQNFNLFKRPAAKANGFSTARARDISHLSHSYHQKAGAGNEGHTRDALTACGADFGTNAVRAQNIASSRRDALCLSRRYNIPTSHNPQSGERGQTSISPGSIRSLHEEAARSRIREKSMEDYWKSWVRLIEEPDHGRPVNMDCSTASLQQDFAVGDYYDKFFEQSLNTKQKFGNLNSCMPHKLAISDTKDIGSCNSGQQSLYFKVHDKFSGHRANSRKHNASSDQMSKYGVDCVKVSQEQYLDPYEGTSGRVDSQPQNSGINGRFPDDGSSHSRMHSIYPPPHNEISGKEQVMHHGWLLRWHSTKKVSSMSGKPLAFFGDNSRSVSTDQLVKLPKSCSASAQCTAGSSCKDISPFEGNLTESGRGSNRYTEASNTRLDSGSASTPGSLPVARNFSAFRGPSIEPMGIVDNSACKLHPKSLQNRSFYRLPCSKSKTLKCVIFSEDGKDADEDKMHLVNLRNLQGDTGGS